MQQFCKLTGNNFHIVHLYKSKGDNSFVDKQTIDFYCSKVSFYYFNRFDNHAKNHKPVSEDLGESEIVGGIVRFCIISSVIKILITPVSSDRTSRGLTTK